MSNFNTFEQAVLTWIYDHNAKSTIGAQLQTAKFKERKYTGSGYYISFDVDKSLPKSDVTKGNRMWPQDGPVIMSREIDGEVAGVLLWGDDEDYANCIEIYSYAGNFPEYINEFRLLTEEEYGIQTK